MMMLFNIANAPAFSEPMGDEIDKLMQGPYPDWWSWPEKKRNVIRKMYENTPDFKKKYWFT